MHKLIVLCGKIVFMKLLPRGCIMLILKQTSCIDSSCSYAWNTMGVCVCTHLGWVGGKKSSSLKQWPWMLNSWRLQSRKLPFSVIQRIIPGSRLLEGEEAGGETSEEGAYNSASEGWEDHHLFCKLAAVTKWPRHSSMLETLLQAVGQLHTVIQRPRFSILAPPSLTSPSAGFSQQMMKISKGLSDQGICAISVFCPFLWTCLEHKKPMCFLKCPRRRK